MTKVNKFIDSMYKRLDGTSEEINILKQEMREHLILTIDELKSEGYTEEDSIKIALQRFGDKKQIGKELISIFNIRKMVVTWVLASALIFLTILIALLICESIGNNYLEKSYKNSGQAEYDYLISHIGNRIKKDKGVTKDNIDMIISGSKEALLGTDTRLKDVRIIKVPKDVIYGDFLMNINYSNSDYNYKGEFSKLSTSYVVFGNSVQTSNATWYIEIRIAKLLDKDFNNMVDFTYKLSRLNLICLALYWILFGVWASIKAYKVRRLHIIWIIMFFTLNLVGYIAFKVTGEANKRNII
ncbi:MAG TPA: permease prefix domain 1-containing protein [Clostridiaceae bacterium]